MKFLFVFIFLLCRLCAGELTFEVVDEIDIPISRLWQMEKLLDAYDAFSAVADAGVLQLPDGGGGHREITFAGARVTCDVPRKSLKITLPNEIDTAREAEIADALLVAAFRRILGRDTTMIDKAKFMALKDGTDTEKDPARRMILSQLLSVAVGPADGSGPRVFLRRKTG